MTHSLLSPTSMCNRYIWLWTEFTRSAGDGRDACYNTHIHGKKVGFEPGVPQLTTRWTSYDVRPWIYHFPRWQSAVFPFRTKMGRGTVSWTIDCGQNPDSDERCVEWISWTKVAGSVERNRWPEVILSYLICRKCVILQKRYKKLYAVMK